jgi:hypothetical protein
VVVGDAAREGLDALDADLPLVLEDTLEPDVAELADDHAPASEAHAHVQDARRGDLHQRVDAERDLLPVAGAQLDLLMPPAR